MRVDQTEPGGGSLVREFVILSIILAVAVCLRIPGFNESLWYDELWSTSVVLRDLGTTVSIALQDVHPPLYPLIMWSWTQLFGDSEISVRSIPLVSGLLSIPLTFAVVKHRVGSPAGLLAAALVAVSPAHIWYSQEARLYSLSMTLVLASVHSFDRAISAGRGRLWLVIYAICAFSAVFLHYYSIAYVATIGAMALVRRSPVRRALVLISLAAVVALLSFVAVKARIYGFSTDLDHLRALRPFELWIAYLDWLPMGSSLREGISLWRGEISDLVSLPGLLAAHLSLALLFGLGVFVAVQAFVSTRDAGPIELILLAATIPALLATLTVVGFERVSVMRAYLTAMPYFFGVLAAGLLFLPRRIPQATASLVLAAIVLSANVTFWNRSTEWTVYKPNPDWRAAAGHIGDIIDSGEKIGLIVSESPIEVLGYYDARLGEGRTSAPDSLEEPAQLTVRGRVDPRLFRISSRMFPYTVQGAIIVVRNHYWDSGANDVIARMNEMSVWPNSTRVDEKGLSLYVYRKDGLQ